MLRLKIVLLLVLICSSAGQGMSFGVLDIVSKHFADREIYTVTLSDVYTSLEDII